MIQAVALILGHRIGEKRAYSLRRRLLAAEIIQEAGSYRPDYTNRAGAGTHRVTLYRLAVGVVAYVCESVLCASHKVVASVGSGGVVKSKLVLPWWQHVLFGDPDGLPPPQLTRRQLKKMRSADERGRRRR